MGFYENMISLLSPLHLYQLTTPNTANAELPIIADYLEIINEEINQLFECCFFDKISARNHNQYCQLFALSKLLTSDTICEIIRQRLSITNRDFTKQGIRKCLSAGGFEVSFAEAFASNIVKITIHSDKGIFYTKEEKEAYILSCLPCHLTAIIVWDTET